MPDRHAQALRRLLRLHLMHARSLRLLEGRERTDIEAFSSLQHSWDRIDLPSGHRFGIAVESAKRFFFDDWRLRGVQPGSRAALCRVVRVRELKYALSGTNKKGSPILDAALRDFDALVSKLSLDAASPAAASEFGALQSVLSGLRAEFVGARLMPYETFASAVHGPGSCWVSLRPPATSAAVSEAQYWRDRLGLHHLPQGATLGDQLVRLTFEADLSSRPCPATFSEHAAARDTMPDELWLARPAVGDVPNPRFVQATVRDTTTLAAATGATIDISTDAYPESEEELVLLHGRDARLRWSDLELLDGLPQRHGRDDDHETFVNLIESRHAILSK